MNRVACYLLGLLCLVPMCAALGHRQSNRLRGVRVLLGGTCPKDMVTNSRLLVLRYLPGDRYFLNGQPAGETEIRQRLRHALEPRLEKLVWIAADQQVSYGEVAALTADVQSDTPDVHVVIATRSKIGPVDPAELESLRAKDPHAAQFGAMPCVMIRPDQIL